jgi:hypothetical protein
MRQDRDLLERIRRQVPPPDRAFERLTTRRRAKARNARLGTATLALLIAALGIGAAIWSFRGPAKTHRPSPLDEGTRLVAAPGEYYYTRTLHYFRPPEVRPLGEDGSSSEPLLGPWVEELWYGPDGSGRATTETEVPRDSSVGRGWITEDDTTFGPGEIPIEHLSDLPTDPDELLQVLTVRSMPGGASPNPIATSSPGRSQQATSLLRTLQDLFAGDEQFTPPLVRVAMFEITRRIEDVEAIERATDPVGRPAVVLRWVVQYEGPPSIVEWYFDPATHQLMASTWTEGGTLLQASIVTDAGIVASTSDVPGPSERFFPSFEGRRELDDS